MLHKILTTTLFGLAFSAGTAYAVTAEDVDKSFFPYKDGFPSAEGITPGMVITKDNVDKAKDVLDPEMYQHIKDGWVEITVGETTDFGLHPNYIQATKDHLNEVKLGEKVGQLENFIAGRAFPEEPDINDPRAGEKLAWNYQYGYNWGDNAAIYPFYWRYRDMNTGKIQREIKFNFHFLNWVHRVNQEPLPAIKPNPSGLFRSIYVQVLEPFDVKNTQLLIHRHQDDLKRDNAWLYLGFQRRVRRLATGQITDSFLGSDLMIEDFEGYNGRISDMNWTYKGTKTILLPFYNHDEQELATDIKEKNGYQFIDFHGKGGCFPKVTYQLRKVYVLESRPVDENHPISKRIHYVDAQTFTLPRTIIYDRKGDYWKSWMICQAHPDHHMAKNKGTGVSIDDCFGMMDVQAMHCTTGQFEGQVDPALNPKKKFTVQNLRATGR
ncbi:MAG TPA: DUF1329 domain-containing protein [Gammaproteobacteria bacterium]|nr:DUF1329 domain-containing protein [Gammaproteobacteria bacterium]